MSGVTVRVPAKVNLWLSVGPPGADGYHELVTVFHAVSLFDEVTARPADGFSVEFADPPPGRIPTPQDNLALRAAYLLAERTGVADGAELTVRKSIPIAGGMAGGSADAAAALVACDALWETELAGDELLRLAARLGADVAFPLLGGTAVGSRRGERLQPVASRGTLHWVFALAGDGLPTGGVYAEYDRLRAEGGEPVAGPYESGDLTAALRAGDHAAVAAALHNDLQPAALSLRPELRRTLEAGRERGALGAVVSGSGPTCAFLARSGAHATELRTALEGAGVCSSARQAYGPVPGAKIVGTKFAATRDRCT